MNHAVHAVASDAHAVEALPGEDFMCLACGTPRLSIIQPECHNPDCASHQTPADVYEEMQWAAEDELHRSRGRYLRGARTIYQG